jgi:hypothetical protein
MARVYEAMLLTRQDAPEATQQFLNDYDFLNDYTDQENESSNTNHNQSSSHQAGPSEAELNATYSESYAATYAEAYQSNSFQPTAYSPDVYEGVDVLDSEYAEPEIAPARNPNLNVDVSVANSLAATVNALTEDLSVLEVDQEADEDVHAVAAPAAFAAPVAVAREVVQPVINRPVSVASISVASAEKYELVPAEYRNDFMQLSEIVLKTSERSPLKVMVVCGVENEDDAGFVSNNLSLALAENSHLKIARFHLPSRKHPARAAHPESSFRIKLNKTQIPNLFDITSVSGDVTLDQLLAECDVQQMTNMLKDRFDFVLIVTDAVNYSERIAPFAASTDGVVLVAKKENMYGQGMNTARKKLQGANARILGAVLNRSQMAQPQQLLQVA